VDPATLAVALLIALRLLPAALTIPVLGGPLAPWPARLALTAMAALALALVQPPEVAAAIAATPTAGLVAIAIKELAVGAVLALIAAVPFLAADTAGRWLGIALGSADASPAFGPVGPTRTTGLLTGLLAVLVFFGIDGHLVVIEALAGSYRTFPLLDGFDRGWAAREALAAIVTFLAAAAALAAPALVAGALVDLVLGLAARSGAAVAGAAALRAAALVAFVAASLILLAVALSRGLVASFETLRSALG
jgi:flagellar biosynthetic protein FliR